MLKLLKNTRLQKMGLLDKRRDNRKWEYLENEEITENGKIKKTEITENGKTKKTRLQKTGKLRKPRDYRKRDS